MNNFKFIKWSILFVLALSIASVFSLTAKAQENQADPKLRLPDPPNEGLPMGIPFDYNIKDKSVYAGRYYFIWGAESPEQPAPVIPSRYLPIGRDYQHKSTDSKKRRNLNWWKENHPDWIVYQSDRVTPAWGFTYSNKESVPLDYSNPEVREWYWENLVLPYIKAGFPIIGFDNCSGADSNWDKRSGHYDRNGKWIEMYSNERETLKDPRSANDLIDWMNYLSKRLHASGIGMAANIGVMKTDRNPDALKRAIEAVDIFTDEGGFTWHRDENVTDEQWEYKVAFLRQVIPNKKYVCNNPMTGPAKPKAAKLHQDVEAAKYKGKLSEASHDQVAYAIGSFLIVREKGSMIHIHGVNEYGSYLDRPELHVKIGAPTEPPSKLPSGVWQRKYTGGLVLVNPSSKKAGMVDLPSGIWQDFGEGREWKNTLELPPNRAMVLLPKKN